jgi:hypothetical protein
MKILTATENIRLMGEMHPKFGQAYWGNVEEQDEPVMFNLMQQVDIQPGRKLVAGEWAMKTSKSGTDYMQLKKVKLSEPSTSVPDEPTGEPTGDDGFVDEWTEENQPGVVHMPPTASSDDETPSYEAGTNARWALKLSTDTYKSIMGGMPDGIQDWTTIEDFAEWLLGAFQRLKAYKPTDEGYNKAKATAKGIKAKSEDEDGGQ